MKLTEQQIKRLNESIKNGASLTTVHNTQHHLLIKINTECIVIQSMLAEHQDAGILINLSDIVEQIDTKLKNDKNEKDDNENPENCK